jgi:8-oxo-dGTP diphosphatase
MIGGLTIRPATAADLPALVEIYNQSEDFLSLGSESPPAQAAAADFAGALGNGGCFCLLEYLGQPAGVMDFSPYAGPDEAHLNLLMLAGPFRGQGLGKAAFNWLERELSLLPGLRRLRADVQDNNPRAGVFWQRMGFEEVGHPALQQDGTTTQPLLRQYDPPFLRYTLCFLVRNREVLLIHRRRSPNRGLWNGIGGHLEPGETALQGMLREIREETGCLLNSARFAGLLTWDGFETPPGGLAIFTAQAPTGCEVGETDEGELAWKPFEFLYESDEVVSNLHTAGPLILAGTPPQVYHFHYHQGHEIGHTFRPLPFFFQI